MKTRFKNNAEVAHIWASQTQHEGRGSNLFFEGTKIYSYGRHFCVANFVRPNVVLFNSAKYSNSTAKHQAYVWRAIPGGVMVFQVPDVDPSFGHKKNLEYLFLTIKNTVFDATKSTKRTAYLLEVARQTQQLAIEYAVAFNIPLVDEIMCDIVAYDLPDLSERIEAQREKAANREAIEEAKRQEKYDKLRKLVRVWQAGNLEQDAIYALPEVYLREKDGSVQTSHGAIVPIKDAHVLYRMIEAGKDIVGHRIGSYTVISLNGVLTIGCHKIEREEIKRFASVMGW